MARETPLLLSRRARVTVACRKNAGERACCSRHDIPTSLAHSLLRLRWEVAHHPHKYGEWRQILPQVGGYEINIILNLLTKKELWALGHRAYDDASVILPNIKSGGTRETGSIRLFAEGRAERMSRVNAHDAKLF